jgi:hypothetical protein
MAKAKAKRANSEGSIYQVADGTWMAAVLIGRDPSTGKLKGKYLRAATRQEAHQRLLHAQGQSISGRLGESPTITMSAWLDLYWHDYVWPNPALVNTSWVFVTFGDSGSRTQNCHERGEGWRTGRSLLINGEMSTLFAIS